MNESQNKRNGSQPISRKHCDICLAVLCKPTKNQSRKTDFRPNSIQVQPVWFVLMEWQSSPLAGFKCNDSRITLRPISDLFIQTQHQHIVNNTELATCFGSSGPSSGQYLMYWHGTFSACVHYGIPYCLQTSFFFNSEFKIYWLNVIRGLEL